MFKAQTRKFAFALLLGLLSGIAAGCAPPVTVINTAVPPTEAPTVVPTDTPIPLPTDTPFVPKATIRIVSEGPSSYDMGLAAELAVDDLSGPLRELGYDVQFTAHDDSNDVDTAIKIAREVIADQEVLCGVGPFTSTVTINVTDLYHVAGLAFITPSATFPKVTDRRYPQVDRLTGRNDVMGTAAAKFAGDQGWATAYVLTDEGDLSSQVSRTFKAEAPKSGVTVVGDLRATVERGNNAAAAALVQAANPAVVFYTGFTWQAFPFFKAVREAGYRGVLLAVEPNPDLALLTGPLALEGGGMYYVSEGAPPAASGPALDFQMHFQIAFLKQPGIFAAESYDAAGICLRAIEEASKAKAGALPTREEVAKAIRAIKDYPGITGTINFDKKGDLLLARYFVRRVQYMDPGEWDRNPVAASFELPAPQ